MSGRVKEIDVRVNKRKASNVKNAIKARAAKKAAILGLIVTMEESATLVTTSTTKHHSNVNE